MIQMVRVEEEDTKRSHRRVVAEEQEPRPLASRRHVRIDRHDEKGEDVCQPCYFRCDETSRIIGGDMTNKTPAERSEVIEKANAKARKGYKRNLKKRTNVTPEELVVIKDMVVSLKLVGYTNTQCAAIVGLSKGQTKEIVNDHEFPVSACVVAKEACPRQRSI
jgi:hypothetical protein